MSCFFLLLQICYHDGVAVDPDKRDELQTNDDHSTACTIVSDFIQTHFKGVGSKSAIQEPCIYTLAVS